MLPSAAHVNTEKQQSTEARKAPRILLPTKPRASSTDARLPLDIPDRAMLGAILLADLYQDACALPFSSAASTLEGVHQLIAHQPDLRPFAAALVLIVEGERRLLDLRVQLARADAEFEAACEAAFVRAVPLLGAQMRRMAQLTPALAEYADAHERVERSAATMTALAAFLAAQ